MLESHLNGFGSQVASYGDEGGEGGDEGGVSMLTWPNVDSSSAWTRRKRIIFRERKSRDARILRSGRRNLCESFHDTNQPN